VLRQHRFNHHLVRWRASTTSWDDCPAARRSRNGCLTYARALARIGPGRDRRAHILSGHPPSASIPCLLGSDDQKRRYLPPSCQGEKILAFGLTEPDAGSNPLELKTTYERQGDHFVLNGRQIISFPTPASPTPL